MPNLRASMSRYIRRQVSTGDIKTTAKALRRAAKPTKEKTVSNRRKLRPHEVARWDQLLARARQTAQEPATMAVVVNDAPEGTQCSWCDCPPGAAVHANGGTCAGCPRPATYITSMFYGAPEQQDIPSCKEHHRDVMRSIVDLTANPGASIEICSL